MIRWTERPWGQTVKKPTQPLEQDLYGPTASTDFAHALLLATLIDLVSAQYNDATGFRNGLMSVLEGEIAGLGIPHDIDPVRFAQFQLATVTLLRRLVTTTSMRAPLPH